MKCLNCGKELENKTVRAKYCSGACKAAYGRRTDTDCVPIQQSTDTSVSQQSTDTRPANYGLADCQCMMCKGSNKVVNHGQYKAAAELSANEVNRVALPGDCDYAGCCRQDEAGKWQVRPKI